MKFNWKPIARFAAQILKDKVPHITELEQSGEEITDDVIGAVTAKTGIEKAEKSVEASIATLKAQAALTGKDLATPRVQSAIRRLNDDAVELMNALAEAHATK